MRVMRFSARDVLVLLFFLVLFTGIPLISLISLPNLIYGMKEGENPVILTLLMLFIIGPAEEIFWRGFVQNKFSKHWNPNVGFIVTTLIYGLVHVSKFNFMLIMAALVAGFIWGLAYRFFPERLGAITLSHALWDCAVFIWFPI